LFLRKKRMQAEGVRLSKAVASKDQLNRWFFSKGGLMVGVDVKSWNPGTRDSIFPIPTMINLDREKGIS